jgi:hypothetical protein
MDKNKGIIIRQKLESNIENSRILYDVKFSLSGDSYDRVFVNAEAFFNEELLQLEDEVNLIWKGDMLFVTKFNIEKKEADLKNVRNFRGK